MAPTGLGPSAGHSPSSSSQTQPAPLAPSSSSTTPAAAAVVADDLEMSDLAPRTGLVTDVSINPDSSSSPSYAPTSTSTTNMAESSTRATPTTTAGASLPNPNSSAAESSVQQGITRLDSVAIGPSTDSPPTPITAIDAGPVLVITLLLTSGARHPYKIDEKYLTKRNVTIKDPYAISVYTLKELILREWREEWEAKPSSPSSIRLIYFGRLLDDKTALKECKFNAESANVIHMTVRPQDIVDEEDASKSKALARDRESNENTAGCRCVIL